MTPLLVSIYLLVLATFVGWQVITKIPPTLHTPLMSGANAISGITVVGALIASHGEKVSLSNILGSLAIAFAMITFLLCRRMVSSSIWKVRYARASSRST